MSLCASRYPSDRGRRLPRIVQKAAIRIDRPLFVVATCPQHLPRSRLTAFVSLTTLATLTKAVYSFGVKLAGLLTVGAAGQLLILVHVTILD